MKEGGGPSGNLREDWTGHERCLNVQRFIRVTGHRAEASTECWRGCGGSAGMTQRFRNVRFAIISNSSMPTYREDTFNLNATNCEIVYGSHTTKKSTIM